MFRAPITVQSLKRGAWLSVTVGLASASMVSAQPAPQPPPSAPQSASVAPPPVQEEAPPPLVPTPQSPVIPPIGEQEVEVAPPSPTELPAKAPETPQRRPRYDVAILQVLDKVTAESLRFEAPVGAPVRYKTLIFTVKACERSAPDEAVEDAIAYLTVDSQPKPEPGRAVVPAKQAFKGWMYASSPGLDPLEHPVYDAWLITCRTAAPATGAPPARAH